MKKLFTAIRQGDSSLVCELLDKKPELISCAAKAPPKKDAGQSPLQVAIKSGHFAIAHLLLDRGADVNFMEAEDYVSDWRMPVVQDAVMAAVMNTRWTTVRPDGVHVSHTQAEADEAYALLERIVRAGADLTRVDSYGNNALDRALLDARRILPQFHPGEKRYLNDRVMSPELDADLTRIFRLLLRTAPGLTHHLAWLQPQEALLVRYLTPGMPAQPDGPPSPC